MNLYSDDIAYLKMGSDRQQAAFITVINWICSACWLITTRC